MFYNSIFTLVIKSLHFSTHSTSSLASKYMSIFSIHVVKMVSINRPGLCNY